MKIPFDIKYRDKIESGEYKVETRDGRPVRIVCYDRKYGYPIMALATEADGHEIYVNCNFDGRESRIYEWPADLFIVTPEPEQSEDERIRKEIVGFIDNVLKDKNVLLLVADRIGDNIPSMIPDWIAYLERQKEYIEDIRQYAYNKGLVDAEEKQKPVNLDEDVELGLDRALQIVKAAKGNLSAYQTDDGIYECEHAIQTLEHILKNGIEQKPAECSEEDEKMLRTIISDGSRGVELDSKQISWLKSLRPRPKQEWSKEDHDYYDAIIAKLEVTQNDAMLTDQQLSFLKSIPERFNIQPKQEWSEGTQKALDEISDYLKYRGMEDEADFIRHLRPRPHWKPSKEQMEALRISYEIGTANASWAMCILKTLYSDLKNL